MSDYIKKEDAMEPLYERWKAAESRSDDDIAEIVKMDYITVSNVPSDDVIEVVRCKDCEFWNKDENILGGICDEWSDFEDGLYRYTRGDGYCSLGERKEQENE